MKKLLKIIIAITMLLTLNCTVFAASSFKDVKSTKYEDAVINLVEVGLVNGFEDNTFRPQDVVTRGQMAKMLVVALGEEGKLSEATKRASAFSDMNASHWSYGYVNIASELKLINGYLDGTFAPDDKVSYAEATAMVIRALGYDEEVAKSKESWPNNYTSYAKKLELYDSLGTVSANNGAPRGDIAILLWNMLRTGVCTVTGQTSNGGLIYGQGTKMLNKYTKYLYLENATVEVDDFDSEYETAEVVFDDETSEIEVELTDDDVFKYFGRTVNVLYNSKKDEVVSIEICDSYKTKTGSITQTPTSKKLYVNDDTYTMPSSNNILYYKIDSFSEAIEAKMIMSGSTVKAVILQGANNVQVGLVVDNDVTVDKKDGIKIKKRGSSSSSSYALIDDYDIPYEDSIIIYYLNSDNELGVLKEISCDDAKKITSLTTTKIKVDGKTYTYNSASYIITEATPTTAKSLTFKNIDKDKDLAYVYEYAGVTYLVVFSDAVSNSELQKTAYDELKAYIKTAEAKEKSEGSYSQATFVPYLNALEEARAVKSTATTTKINSALAKLKEKYTALKSVSSSSAEGKIAKARASLRTVVNGTAAEIIKNKSAYVVSTYNTFKSEYDDSVKLLARVDTTLTEVQNATSELNGAITNLDKISETQEHKDAVKKLEAVLAKCQNIVESNYTEASLTAYRTAKTKAETTKKNNANLSHDEISKIANDLENAIKELDLVKDELVDKLNSLIADCVKNIIPNEKKYMPEKYSTFVEAYEAALALDVETATSDAVTAVVDALDKAIDGLVTRLEVLTEYIAAVKASEIVNATEVKKLNLGEASSYNEDEKIDLIEAIESAVRDDFEALINNASEKAAEQGTSGDGSLEVAIGNAKKVLNSSSSTLKNLVEAYDELYKLIK